MRDRAEHDLGFLAKTQIRFLASHHSAGPFSVAPLHRFSIPASFYRIDRKSSEILLSDLPVCRPEHRVLEPLLEVFVVGVLLE